MKDGLRIAYLTAGVVLGFAAAVLYTGPAQPAAAGDSRTEDYVMSTGPVLNAQGVPTDGLWLLDYRSGKLLGTVIDRSAGKVLGWAEVDLVKEFDIQPKQNVHFMMTTGMITKGQAALYLTETTTGKLGIYTMGSMAGGNGVAIRRHDLLFFRQPRGQNN